MTKKELKREAEEKGDKWIKWAIDNKSLNYWNSYVEGYLAGAEPREKRIAELKEKLDNLASVAEVRLANWLKYEKENKELKSDLETMISLLEKAKGMAKGLSEAKEIIKSLCRMVKALNNPNVQLTDVDYSLKDAEQFLKECE